MAMMNPLQQRPATQVASGGMQRPARPGGLVKSTWVVRAEHFILRAVSFGFSIASAYAISQMFAPPDVHDMVRMIIDFVIAGGFGVAGFFLSRNIAYRLMNHESVWAYVPICLVVELVEIFCNYVMGVSEVPHAYWLHAVPPGQLQTLMSMAYWVVSSIPVVSLFLAVADMDLERRKVNAPHVKTAHPTNFTAPAFQGGRPVVAAAPRGAQQGQMAVQQQQTGKGQVAPVGVTP